MSDANTAFVVAIRKAIRTGSYKPAAAEEILTLARLTSQHATRDHDASDLFIAIAMAIQIDRGDRTSPAAVDFATTAWAMISSPNGLSSAILQTLPRQDPTAADILAAVEAKITQDEADRARSQVADPSAAIREIVDQAGLDHPRLGLSFGYIGNCDLGGRYDDRSWSVYAKLATPRCHGACDVRFGGYETGRLGDLLVAVERRLPAWLAEQERRLDASEIRQVRG
jgi:hypothetical protein